MAGEVRVFPLLELGSRPSRHIGDVLAVLNKADYTTAVIEKVDYEFQRGGDEMLVVVQG